MISICIPIYEMHGRGEEMLRRCLNSIAKQTFKDYEVVVSNNSAGDWAYLLCNEYAKVRYIYNPIRGMAINTNNAMKKAKGELIKVLYQDDYFAHENALQEIVDKFKPEDVWMITACSNNPAPFYSINNTLGSPSVLTMRNKLDMWFDESLTWVLDLDLYKRLYKKYGEPKILLDVNVVIGLGPHQVTNNLSLETKINEENFINRE